MDNQRNTPINRQRSSTSNDPDPLKRSASRSPQSDSLRTSSRQGERSPASGNAQGAGTTRKRSFGDRVAIDPRENSSSASSTNTQRERRSVNTDLYQPGEIPEFVPVGSRRPLNPIQQQSIDTRGAQRASQRRPESNNNSPGPEQRPRRPVQASADNHNDGGRPLKNGSGGGGNPPKKPKKKAKTWVNVLKWMAIVMVSLGLVGGIGGFIYVQTIIAQVPPIDPSKITEGLGENSIIVDANGKVLETLQNDGVRKIIKYSDMSPTLINAFVAVEDKTFWEHNGFNVVRLVGSVWQGFSKGDRIKGTSTITQQLARNIYLVEIKSVRSIERKIKEAHYAIQIEKHLQKEQIIEAYLNTIYLGAGSNGVEAAAQAYFSKEAKDLDLVESAMIAGIPASPLNYSPMRTKEKVDVTPDDIIIDDSDELYTIVYNTGCEKRYAISVRLMYDNGKITKEEYEIAKKADLVAKLKPSKPATSDIASYFADMVKNDVADALMEKYDYTKSEAIAFLYNQGLTIHSTVDYKLQKALEAAYEDNSKSMPKITVTFDGNGNVINKDGAILLYKYENLVNGDQELVIPSSDFKKDASGNLVLLKGKRLNFYPKYQDNKLANIQLVIKSVYKGSELKAKGISASGRKNVSNFNTYTGKDILVPTEFKSLDENKNLVISKNFLDKNPDFFRTSSKGSLLVKKENYVIAEKGVVQPQSATVVIDYHTGALKAIVGGRNVGGQKIYNRAINPRQPGSSIKPIAVYLPAIDTKTFTAASVIDDSPTFLGPNNSRWPMNWYEGTTRYWGLQTVRESMMWSINVNAVKVAKAVGFETSIKYLKKLGITSVVEEGASNDNNLSAMALGGMTKGISPVEMAGAYGSIANNGERVETITFTTVEDRNGQVILENTPDKTLVASPEASYITLDMMRSTVTSGLAQTAAIYSGNKTIPIAGKTGTTSNQMDAWFVGVSPYYSASVWFGNDLNIPLDQGSKVSAKFWQIVMKKMHEGLPAKNFTNPGNIKTVTIDTKSGLLPSSLSKSDPRGTVRSEMFIPGTEPSEVDDVHVSIKVCKDSNRLPGPNCPDSALVSRVFVKRKVPVVNPDGIAIRDWAYEVPTSTCNIHSAPLKTTYKDQFVVANSDGTYKVVASFDVTLIDGTVISLPVGTVVQADKSFLLPDGTAIMPYDITSYPDLEKLKGTPVKEVPPTTPVTTDPGTNPEVLIDEADSGIGN